MAQNYAPILAFAAVVLAFGGGVLALSHVLGPRKRTPRKFTPYECGVPLLDSARQRFHVKFYLVATLFILFDIETVFLLPWAVVYRKIGLSPAVLVGEMFAFVGVLAVGFVYLWRKGAFEWD